MLLSINLKEEYNRTLFLRGSIFSVLHPGQQKPTTMIRKLKSGEFRIYSRKKDPKTNKRRNLGTFHTIEEAKKHERAIQYFKHR